MGFKKMETNLSFTDISLFISMEHNRAITRMEQINAIVDWSRIENLLLKSYPVGKSNEGNEAYPPLILMKWRYQSMTILMWFNRVIALLCSREFKRSISAKVRC